jgi:hypothetical protein
LEPTAANFGTVVVSLTAREGGLLTALSLIDAILFRRKSLVASFGKIDFWAGFKLYQYQTVSEPDAGDWAGDWDSSSDVGQRPIRGYCLEMICADFLAGPNLDHGDPEMLLFSTTRFFKFLP